MPTAMVRLERKVAPLAVLLILAVSTLMLTPKSGTGADIVSSYGYENNILLENETARVVICPRTGGRILEYSINEENILYRDPAQDGWVYEPGEPVIDPGGGRFDIGPEKLIPPHPVLWAGEWSGEITGPRSARLISQADSATGVQLIREFRLDSVTSRLESRQIMKNISADTVRWCYWSRTLATGGGIVIVPIEGRNRYPNKYIMYEENARISYNPSDPDIRVSDNYVEVLHTPRESKIALESYAGWMAYLTQEDLLLVKKYPVYPGRVHHELAGFNVSVWYKEERMTEVEPIGPEEILAPGEAAAYTESWWLTPYSFPEQREDVDPDTIRNYIRENMR